METGKSILESKTFWLNVAGLVATILPLVPPQYSLPALAFLNILNRFITSEPIQGVLPKS